MSDQIAKPGGVAEAAREVERDDAAIRECEKRVGIRRWKTRAIIAEPMSGERQALLNCDKEIAER
jgi:hypothetical protein